MKKLEYIKAIFTLNYSRMTEETKKQLMQYLQKVAAHYEIPNAELVTFKKRSVLLELLSTKNEVAHALVSELIETALVLDRIQNDKEKQEKRPEHWNEEVAKANEVHLEAQEELKAFFEEEGII